MKYFVLIAHSPTGWHEMTADEQADAMRQHGAFHRAVGSGMLAGEALADPEAATTFSPPSPTARSRRRLRSSEASTSSMPRTSTR